MHFFTKLFANKKSSNCLLLICWQLWWRSWLVVKRRLFYWCRCY